MTTVVRSVAGHSPWNWFEALAIGVLIATGAWFTITAWPTLVGSGRAWVLLALVIGSLSAIAVVPLRNSGHHGFAAAVAIVSIVTPTGFAYIGNLLMIAVSLLEFVRFRARRSA